MGGGGLSLSPLGLGCNEKISLPVLGLRGETSDTLSRKAFARWRRLQPQADLRECEGGHLLPLEFPQGTADQVLGFLAQQEH